MRSPKATLLVPALLMIVGCASPTMTRAQRNFFQTEMVAEFNNFYHYLRDNGLLLIPDVRDPSKTPESTPEVLADEKTIKRRLRQELRDPEFLKGSKRG